MKRGVPVDQTVSDQYQVGEVISSPAYTSTSLTKDFGGNVNFVIHARTGRFIGLQSVSRGEDEVPIPPGAKFKVLDRQTLAPGALDIILDEIDPKIRPKAKN